MSNPLQLVGADQNIVYEPLSLPKPQLDAELPTPAPQNIPEWRNEPVQLISMNRSIVGPVLAISSFCIIVLLGLIFSATVLLPTSFAFGYPTPFAFNCVSLFVCVLPFLLLAIFGSRDATLSLQCTAFFAGEVFFIPYVIGMIGVSILVTLPGWGVHSVGIVYAVFCLCFIIFCATAGYFMQFVVLFRWTSLLQNRLTPVALALAFACGFNFLFVAVGSSAWSALTTTTNWLENWEYIFVELVIIFPVPMVNIVAAGLVGKAVGEHKFEGKPLVRAVAPALFFLFSFYFIIIVAFMPFLLLLHAGPAFLLWMLLSVLLGMIYSVCGVITLKRFRAKAAIAINTPEVLYYANSLE